MNKTKYELHITGECRQNLKLCKKRGLPMQELWDVVAKLLRGEKLEEKYQPNQLHGNRKGQWECHIQPDWLLIWEQRDYELILVMVNTGKLSKLSSYAHRQSPCAHLIKLQSFYPNNSQKFLQIC